MPPKRKLVTSPSGEKKKKGSLAQSLATDFVHEESGIVSDFLKFSHGSTSPFHCVAQAKKLLEAGGFKEISEKSDDDFTKIAQNGKYFFTRNQSSLVAFAVGGKYVQGNGFVIAAAHTDSPVLRVKPVSKTASQGYEQIGVETYGGGLWYTWFDRDLSLAGRVVLASEDGKFESKLVDLQRPLLKVPSLAIHLNRDIYTEGFKPNAQTHLLPIFATSVKSQLASEKKDKEPESYSLHNSLLIRLIAENLKTATENIRDFELNLYDTQPPQQTGVLSEFISARGLDNQLSSFVITRALIDGINESKDLKKDFKEETQIRMVVLFDHEEIGSQSFYGASSSFVPEVLERLNNDKKSFASAIRKSFLLSCDMAHAVHPNYSDKHESNHRPLMHHGLVIKENASQRYATNSLTAFYLTEVAKRHGLPIQRFVVRNDMPCGSTIGPIVSAHAGIRTVDVGIPQLAMHSIRETCGTKDILTSYQLLKHFYDEFRTLDDQTKVDKDK